MKKTIMQLFAVAIAILLSAVPAFCWSDVTTHPQMTREAFRYLIEHRLLQGFPAFPSTVQTVEENLALGSTREDTDNSTSVSILWIPFGTIPWRTFFHFDPRLDASVAQGVIQVDVSGSCTSLQWALEEGACRANIHNNLFSLTTELTNRHTWGDATGRAATAEGWHSLGFVLHLIEDLTSPAHVRNDPHILSNTDPVEDYAKQVPVPPFSGELPTGDFSTQSFTELQQFVQSNFCSLDTCFRPGIPSPEIAAEDGDYFYDASGRKIAYKGPGYYYALNNGFPQPERFVTINTTIASEQYQELSQLAVKYAAAAIKYYYDNEVFPKIQPRTYIIPAVNSGFYTELGIGANPSAYPMNYLVGSNGILHRNFFVFDLRTLPLDLGNRGYAVQAYLEIYNPTNGFVSPQGSETYEVRDVSTPIDVLTRAHPAQNADPAIYNDLGTGYIYGRYTATDADNGRFIRIELNPLFFNAILPLVETQPRPEHLLFAVGGALTTLSGASPFEYLFGTSQDPGVNVQLVVIMSPLPA